MLGTVVSRSRTPMAGSRLSALTDHSPAEMWGKVSGPSSCSTKPELQIFCASSQCFKTV